MIKSMYFKNEFKTQKELIQAICKNHKTIIDFKEKQIYKSNEKGQGIVFNNTYMFLSDTANKENSFIKQVKENRIYPIINSTNWLDFHDDVHLKGCYKKTVKEQQGKVYFVDAHQKTTQSIITYKSDVRMFYDNVLWQTLGKDYDGETEALIFDIENSNVKDWALELINKEKDIQCSLAMKYGQIFFAVDTDEKEYKANKELFEQYKSEIINQDDLEQRGYFFGVKEIQIMGEGSMCPISGGSNSATTIYQIEPAPATQPEIKEEPIIITQKRKSVLIY
jgi:hypothetical protein